jgi:hypothetical protein
MAAMNARPGSARAFARTVRNLMDWEGQRDSFFHSKRALGPRCEARLAATDARADFMIETVGVHFPR